MGDFRATDPIFKGCYGDSLLYTSGELNQLRWQGIHLPPFWGKIPALSAPSYQQARQPKTMKQSPPRAATPSPPVESPKAKYSGGKGSPHCGSGHSSNTSTLKCPDSYFHQEAFQFQGANLKWPGEVSEGMWIPQAWPFPFPIHQISQTQMERCLHGGQPHTQLNSSCQLQHL